MDDLQLAELLFPHIDKTPEDYETIFPPRDLPAGARVTRLGPSPTGFIHLGNLYGAFADERLAHQSGGLFILRIEDTDSKREVEGAVEAVISSLDYFGVHFDEGAVIDGEKGAYGPYYQRQRAAVYQAVAKRLVAQGFAYPCFCSEEALQAVRDDQIARKENFGYYGRYAKCRDLSAEEIARRIAAGEEYVVRLRSPGDPARSFAIEDGIRGRLEMPENEQDVVLLKTNGIPTYHFAHVVDDHYMRVTHILRGEEWLSSLPIHVQLFGLLGWKMPVFCHTTLLMKMDEGVKRKLSKRKDPELSLDFYRQQGYHAAAVREYLLTLLNSNFEEWRLANPEAELTDFPFTIEKMGSSGALFDLEKLNDISQNVLARQSAAALAEFFLAWAERYHPETDAVFAGQADYLAAIFDVGRAAAKPRKDLVYGEQMLSFIRFYFDEFFRLEDEWPEQVARDEAAALLRDYLAAYDYADDAENWFGKVRELAVAHGFAAKPKDFKKNPEAYKGHVGDVSAVLRVAISGRKNSPDLWEIQQVMGDARVRARLTAAIEALGE